MTWRALSISLYEKLNVITAAAVRSRFKGLFAHISATDHLLQIHSDAA